MTWPGGYQPPPYQQPYQPPYGYPAASPPPGTNGFAIASFVLSMLCVFPLALIFGIIALVQTKDGKQGGRGLAIAGLVISVVMMVGLGALVAIGIATSGDDQHTASTTTRGYPSFSFPSSQRSSGFNLSVGDCIEDLPSGSRVFSMPVVSCSSPHRGEVFAVLTLTGTSYPGQDAMDAYADKCSPALDQYSPSAASDGSYGIYYLYPTAQTWSDGDREFVCIVTTDDARTGSVR